MKIAIVGSGISGLTAASCLHANHQITVFEADDWIGGHTHTVDVPEDNQTVAVDTGFIVFNDWTYPEFIQLINRIGVKSHPSDMSFSLVDERSDLEYNGTTLNSLFAQRSNLFSPSFLGMIADILRFNKDALRFLRSADHSTTLQEFLRSHRYRPAFIERYIVPMGRAIWSAEQEALLGFPAHFFIDFFSRHGFLSVNNRPQWQAIAGGSREYVRALTKPFAERIRIKTPVSSVTRDEHGVKVVTSLGETSQFDAVLFACHSDQALRLLDNPSRQESQILSAIGYQPNDVVLHTDSRLLPKRPLARAAWNYRICSPVRADCTLTYDMNVLQSLRSQRRYLVSLNLRDRIDPATILGAWSYAHPVYSPEAVRAQGRQAEISGHNRTFYCGAYWRYGFHEDGVLSGLHAAAQIDDWNHRAQRAL